MKGNPLLRVLWLVMAIGLVLCSNGPFRDAALVGNLWLTMWTFPTGPAIFVAQLHGVPTVSPFLPHYFEQVGIVVLSYAFNFWLVPKIRDRWRSSRGKSERDPGGDSA